MLHAFKPTVHPFHLSPHLAWHARLHFRWWRGFRNNEGTESDPQVLIVADLAKMVRQQGGEHFTVGYGVIVAAFLMDKHRFLHYARFVGKHVILFQLVCHTFNHTGARSGIQLHVDELRSWRNGP